MAKSGKPPLENAVEIIEKFGGIRPMASKTGVAVTTIQGWKKRGVIPGARKEAVLASAAEHDIDLSGLVEGALSLSAAEPEEETKSADLGSLEETISSENKPSEEEKERPEETEDSSEEEEENPAQEDDLDIPPALKRTAQAESPKRPIQSDRDYTEFRVEGRESPTNRSMIIALVIVLLILAALLGMVMKKDWNNTQRDVRVIELENRLSSVKKEQSGFKGLVPENWSEELEQLKRQAEQVKKGVSNTVNDVKTASRDLASAEGINNRVAQLQTYVSEISGEKGVYALKARFDKMRNDYMGSKVLDSSVQALLPLIQQMQNQGQGQEDESRLNLLIAQARAQNTALQTSFGNVPQNELKAAAMLLALTQTRSALNRPEEKFDDDLELLLNMVGDDDPELKAAIEKLAPYSKEGVLTPAGVKREFQSVAGEAVAASLSGEDVSVSDKFSAKFNELLQVEKDGELITGTPTQATVNKAETLVEANRFEDAIAVLKSNLHAKELEPLQPWIKKAEGLIASKRLDDMIGEAIELNFGPGLLGGKVLENKQY